ncbi:MAG: hypothetical protein P0Y53_09925 [Candidatus Pseudobacter hemicellulosilyticus]|uniref:Uncharacterized protein n=1 Tax=Candidatus Pseudobacter hemicellulosilyticus TaxID=3121375 RepID=A0AAJ6BJD6_9BACT|nr:MAG: hypothetical protein P0Y53_09925 [Pseudobacter sp.]
MKKIILWPTSALLVGALSGFASVSPVLNNSYKPPAVALYARLNFVCVLICPCPNAALFMTGVPGFQATITSGTFPTVYLLYENNVCTIPVVFN